MVVDSGFKITAMSFFLQTIGFSKVNFNGFMELPYPKDSYQIQNPILDTNHLPKLTKWLV